MHCVLLSVSTFYPKKKETKKKQNVEAGDPSSILGLVTPKTLNRRN